MSADTKKSAERLHQVLADTSGLTNAELRRLLQAEGVDVNAYLRRIQGHAPAAPAARAVEAASADVAPVDFCGGFEALPLAARKPDGKPGSVPPQG
jgi:hypothetical protein